MGQAQSSSSDIHEDDVIYSPSAIGYTKPPRQHYTKKIFYATSQVHEPRESQANPTRNQSRQKHNDPLSNSDVDLEERKDSVDLLRQVVASTLGTSTTASEEFSGVSTPIWEKSIPTMSIIGPNRVPAQETIIEETDSMMPDSSRLACLELPADSNIGPLEESGRQLDRSLLLVTNQDVVSRRGSASTLLRRLTDDADGRILLAYWQEEGNDKQLQRRHSLSEAEGASINEISRSASSFPGISRRWTSSWEADKINYDGQIGRKLDRSQSELLCVPFSRSYRKPAPKTSPDDIVEEKIQKMSPTIEKQQYILWPAKEDNESVSYIRQSKQINRASVSSEALHSHVDALREGPRFFVDPSASDLMKSVDNVLESAQSISSNGVIRPRKISMIAKLKNRVRRYSEIQTRPSLMSTSTSKQVITPIIQTKIIQERGEAKLNVESGPKRNRKSALDSKEADILAARAVKRHSNRTSLHSTSSSTRSKRQSIKSIHSTSTARKQQFNKEQGTSTSKTRSQLQPPPRQRHWWKQQIWTKKPRRESLVSKMIDAIDSGRRDSLVMTNDSLNLAEDSSGFAEVNPRESTPFAFVNSEDTWTPDPNEHPGFGFSSSSSDFSSLARARLPAPIPPPRPSRKQRQSSSINGGDRSIPSSPMISQARRESYQYRLESPLGRAVSPLTLSAFSLRPTSALQDHQDKIQGEKKDSEEHLNTIDDKSCKSRRSSNLLGVGKGAKSSVDGDDESGLISVYNSALSDRGQVASIDLNNDSKMMHKNYSLTIPVSSESRVDRSAERENSISSIKTTSTFGGKKTVRTSATDQREEHKSSSFSLPPLQNLLPSQLELSDYSLQTSKSPVQSTKRLPTLQTAHGDVLASSTLGKKSGRITIRESWNSSDGPWEAHVVNMESKKMSPVRGFAQPVKQGSFDLLRRGQSCTSIKKNLAGEGQGEIEVEASDPVPFAETAVQASLAALKALEESEQSGDELKSRWKREKLMGSSIMSSTAVPSVLAFTGSRRRRKAAPYPRSEDAFSIDERTKHRRNRENPIKAKNNDSSVTSQTENHSAFLAFTSDSDRAGNVYEQEDQRMSSEKRTAASRKGMSRQSGSTIQATNPSHALAKRLREEADVDAKVAEANRKMEMPKDRVLKDTVQDETSYDSVLLHTWKKLESMREGDNEAALDKLKLPSRERFLKEEAEWDNRIGLKKMQDVGVQSSAKAKKDHHHLRSVSSSLPRQSKIRKGYGCEDIKAWQASLRIASMPVSPLE